MIDKVITLAGLRCRGFGLRPQFS